MWSLMENGSKCPEKTWLGGLFRLIELNPFLVKMKVAVCIRCPFLWSKECWQKF